MMLRPAARLVLIIICFALLVPRTVEAITPIYRDWTIKVPGGRLGISQSSPNSQDTWIFVGPAGWFTVPIRFPLVVAGLSFAGILLALAAFRLTALLRGKKIE